MLSPISDIIGSLVSVIIKLVVGGGGAPVLTDPIIPFMIAIIFIYHKAIISAAADVAYT